MSSLVLDFFPCLWLLFKIITFWFRVQLRPLNKLDEKDCLSNSTIFYSEFSAPSILFPPLITSYNLQAIYMIVHHREVLCYCCRMSLSPTKFLFSCWKAARTLWWMLDGYSIKNFCTRNLENFFLVKSRLTLSMLFVVSLIVWILLYF